MTFLSEGLGPARDNFSTDLVRLKDLRQRTASMHDQQAAMHKETREMIEEQWRARTPPQGGEEVGWWLASEEERLSQEPRTTREMMLTYLITTLDVFFGQWREENNIGSGWPPADPDRIEEAFQAIAKARLDPALAMILQVCSRDRLVEIRARRDVVVHRGGKADQRYCDKTQEQTVLGQRLPVDDDYLDEAVEFVDDLVAAMAARVCSGPQSAVAAAARQPLIAKIFV